MNRPRNSGGNKSARLETESSPKRRIEGEVLSPNIVVGDPRTDGTRNWTHQGIDIAAPAGTPIRASAGGVVSRVGFDEDGYGHYVYIDHGEGIETRYAHMESPSGLAEGARVYRGSALGGVGIASTVLEDEKNE